MKIFMVAVIFGKVVMTVGPVPSSIDTCKHQAALQESDWDRAWSERNLDESDATIVEGRRVRRADIHAFCVESDVRPPLGSDYAAKRSAS